MLRLVQVEPERQLVEMPKNKIRWDQLYLLFFLLQSRIAFFIRMTSGCLSEKRTLSSASCACKEARLAVLFSPGVDVEAGLQ